MAGQAAPGGQTTPPNINSLAAQGIQGAGMGSAAGMGYSPLSVTAGNVTPGNVTASNVGVSGLSPTVTAGQLGTTNLAPYMNPYTQQVIDASQADILRGANLGLSNLGAQAQAAGSFGGSRHGIAMSEMGRGVADIMGQQSAGLRQAGYQNAQQAAMQDIMNDYNAQLANQQADLSGAQYRLGAANQLGNMANLGFGMGQQVQQNIAQQGAMQQALQQAIMDAAQDEYQGYTGHPALGLGYVSSALGATPTPTNTTQTTTKKPGLFDYLTLQAMMGGA